MKRIKDLTRTEPLTIAVMEQSTFDACNLLDREFDVVCDRNSIRLWSKGILVCNERQGGYGDDYREDNDDIWLIAGDTIAIEFDPNVGDIIALASMGVTVITTEWESDRAVASRRRLSAEFSPNGTWRKL